MTYYGLSLNVSNLVGSVRVNFLVSTAVELAGYCAAWYLLDKVGRMRCHCSVMLLAGTACLSTIVPLLVAGPGQSQRERGRERERERERERDRQTDRQTDRQADKQTDRQTETFIKECDGSISF